AELIIPVPPINRTFNAVINNSPSSRHSFGFSPLIRAPQEQRTRLAARKHRSLRIRRDETARTVERFRVRRYSASPIATAHPPPTHRTHPSRAAGQATSPTQLAGTATGPAEHKSGRLSASRSTAQAGQSRLGPAQLAQGLSGRGQVVRLHLRIL